MTRRNPLVALLLSLCLMLGAVSEAVARSEMAGMTDLVLCGADGQTTLTLDAQGNPVQRHPCTHCLAATDLAVLNPAVQALPPLMLRAMIWHRGAAIGHVRADVLTPLARGPPAIL